MVLYIGVCMFRNYQIRRIQVVFLSCVNAGVKALDISISTKLWMCSKLFRIPKLTCVLYSSNISTSFSV